MKRKKKKKKKYSEIHLKIYIQGRLPHYFAYCWALWERLWALPPQLPSGPPSTPSCWVLAANDSGLPFGPESPWTKRSPEPVPLPGSKNTGTHFCKLPFHPPCEKAGSVFTCNPANQALGKRLPLSSPLLSPTEHHWHLRLCPKLYIRLPADTILIKKGFFITNWNIPVPGLGLGSKVNYYEHIRICFRTTEFCGCLLFWL